MKYALVLALLAISSLSASAQCAKPVFTTDEKSASDLCRKHSSSMGYDPDYKDACVKLQAALKTKYFDVYDPCVEAEKKAAEDARKTSAQGDVDLINKAAGQ